MIVDLWDQTLKDLGLLRVIDRWERKILCKDLIKPMPTMNGNATFKELSFCMKN